MLPGNTVWCAGRRFARHVVVDVPQWGACLAFDLRFRLYAGMSPALEACVQRHIEALGRAAPGLLATLPAKFADSLPQVFAASEFLAEACVRDPEMLADPRARSATRNASAESVRA